MTWCSQTWVRCLRKRQKSSAANTKVRLCVCAEGIDISPIERKDLTTVAEMKQFTGKLKRMQV